MYIYIAWGEFQPTSVLVLTGALLRDEFAKTLHPIYYIFEVSLVSNWYAQTHELYHIFYIYK